MGAACDSAECLQGSSAGESGGSPTGRNMLPACLGSPSRSFPFPLLPSCRSIFKPQFQGAAGGAHAAGIGAATSASSAGVAASRWFLTDRIATLREAFRRTPRWLGFNIELKYPTPMEITAMRCQMWSRNHFVDAVLKVGAGRRRARPPPLLMLMLMLPTVPVLHRLCHTGSRCCCCG